MKQVHNGIEYGDMQLISEVRVSRPAQMLYQLTNNGRLAVIICRHTTS